MRYQQSTPQQAEPSLAELIEKLKRQLQNVQTKLQKNLSREKSLCDEIAGHGGEVVSALQKGQSAKEQNVLPALLACRKLGADVPRDVEFNPCLPWKAMRGVGERMDKAITSLLGGDLSEAAIQKIADCLCELVRPTVAKRGADPVEGEARAFVSAIRGLSPSQIVAKLESGTLCRHTARMCYRWAVGLSDIQKRLEDVDGARLNIGLALSKFSDPENTLIRKRENAETRADAAFEERVRIGAVDGGLIEKRIAETSEAVNRFVASGISTTDKRFTRLCNELDRLSHERSLLRRLRQ